MKLRWGRIISVFLVFILLIGVGIYFLFFNKKEEKQLEEPDKQEPVVEKKLQILDLESDTRPIAVMINNHKTAQPYQTGLNDAYLVYEIVVEGGITRMMAVFKDQDTATIGTVRSSRHYFLDYAQENDAIYTHFGWSEKAQQDINDLNIDNVNGLVDSGFWRDQELRNNGVPLEHTAYTNIENILKVADKRGYETTSTKDTLLNYSVDEIDLSTMEGAIKADNVFIEYSSYQENTFKYDPINKVYNKYSGDTLRKDYVTGEAFKAKNIITYQVNNYSMDSYGRQEIDNIGSGEGYFISNGYAVPITWEKKSPSSQTIYKFLDGKEITVNDGITYIQIQPKGKTLEIE